MRRLPVPMPAAVILTLAWISIVISASANGTSLHAAFKNRRDGGDDAAVTADTGAAAVGDALANASMINATLARLIRL